MEILLDALDIAGWKDPNNVLHENHLELFTQGNIQKLRKVYFVATDTKPSDPLPLCVQICGKKSTPISFIEIESMIAKTNFTLGSIEKSIFFLHL